MKNINKVVHIGKCQDGEIFAKVEYKDGNLSISGVIGPRRVGNCTGSAGQFIMSFKEYDERGYITLDDITPAPGWNKSSIESFFDIWDEYHLNDMQAGCKHQRRTWNPSEKLTLTSLSPDSLYHREEDRAKSGSMTPEEYSIWGDIHTLCDSAWLHGKPSHENLWSDGVKNLIKLGYLKINKPETKNAGWVYPTEHPQGILTKACPVCGYKYGSAWLKSAVPSSVIKQIEDMPETDITPAWV